MDQQSSKPASAAEISAELQVLFDSGLPFQRGVKVDQVAATYIGALRGCSADAIRAGIQKFLRGECDGVSDRFIPTQPELARIIRKTVVPQRVPLSRFLNQHRAQQPIPGENARMRLKMPMWQAAQGSPDRMAALDRANRDGFAAMVVLATNWGVSVPQELLERPEREVEEEWHRARNRAVQDAIVSAPPALRRWMEARNA